MNQKRHTDSPHLGRGWILALALAALGPSACQPSAQRAAGSLAHEAHFAG